MQCAIIYKNILTYYYNLEWLLCQTVSFFIVFSLFMFRHEDFSCLRHSCCLHPNANSIIMQTVRSVTYKVTETRK